jgi:adenylylsulfate kinase/bifunctional enzyme CysN/CysC
MIGELVGPNIFLEVFVDCPLDICEQRDVKGLYGKARQGLIPNFTGIDSPYQPPENPFVTIKSAEELLEDSVQKIVSLLTPQISI